MLNTILLLLFACLAGMLLGVNRSLLGTIGNSLGPKRASLVNHASGFIFIIILMLFMGESLNVSSMPNIPIEAYLGGVIGAGFVIITSFVIPKIGVLKTSMIFISGQMTCGVLIDFLIGNLKDLPSTLLGLFLILIGVSLNFYKTK